MSYNVESVSHDTIGDQLSISKDAFQESHHPPQVLRIIGPKPKMGNVRKDKRNPRTCDLQLTAGSV